MNNWAELFQEDRIEIVPNPIHLHRQLYNWTLHQKVSGNDHLTEHSSALSLHKAVELMSSCV